MSGLKFGTSGLRGLVTELVGQSSYGYAAAFLRTLAPTMAGQKRVLIGRDLRSSSSDIAMAVAAAARDEGFVALDCGVVPTPALALAALDRGAAAIMVTGSHIPDDRNGLKFYRPEGEITKADEAPILAALPQVGRLQPGAAGTPEPQAIEDYRQRYLRVFAPDALVGLRVAVYQQSSVARDLLVELLAALGATPMPIGRSEVFVPIDTEAHRPEDIAFIRAATAETPVDALVTTDGDADRPLIADAEGVILRGDVIGMITARAIGADTVVVPVTAGSAIERSGGFARVMRTKVGSPHVIDGMARAAADGAKIIAGFEANGGFLLGSDVMIAGRPLGALPTRDAVLPIIATLAAMRAAKLSLQALVASLDVGETASDRLEHVPAERSAALLARLGDDDFAADFVRSQGNVLSIDRLDGTRINLSGKKTIHFRPSGNAPELRCYAEAESKAEAEQLVSWGLKAAETAMKSQA